MPQDTLGKNYKTQAAADAANNRLKVTAPVIPTNQQIPKFNTPGIGSYPAPQNPPPIQQPKTSGFTVAPVTPPKFPGTTDASGNPVNNQNGGGSVNPSTPWLNADGSTNKNYTPSSQNDPAFSQVDAYTRDILYANYQKSLGTNLPTSANGVNYLPTSDKDKLANTEIANMNQTSYLDEQVFQAKKKAQEQLEHNQSSVNAGIGAVNREGAGSVGNQLTAKNINTTLQGTYNTYAAQLDQQLKTLADAQASGNAELVDQMSAQVAQTQIKLADAQSKEESNINNLLNTLASSNALVGLTPEEIDQVGAAFQNIPLPILQSLSKSQTEKFGSDQSTADLARQNTATNMFVNAATSGIQLTSDYVAGTAQALGVDPSKLQAILDSSNMRAQVELAQKGLDAQQTQSIIAKNKQDLTDQINGLTTAAGQNIKALQYLYKKGASPEEISAFKQAAGINDYNDPLTKAKLQFDQAQGLIEYKHSMGMAVTPQDQLALANAQSALADITPYGSTPTVEGAGVVSVAQNYVSSGDWKTAFKNNPILEDGTLGCAYVASDILVKAGILDKPIMNIATMVPTLQKKGWVKSDTPVPGGVVVWAATAGTDGHKHIGVVTGPDSAVNNQGPTGPADTKIFNGRPVEAFYAPPVGSSEPAGFEDYYNSLLKGANFTGMTNKEVKAFKDDARTKALALTADKLKDTADTVVDYSKFKDQKVRLDKANAGESNQVRSGNTESFNNAVKTGDPAIVKDAIDEIERKKYLPRVNPIQDDFEKGTKDFQAIKQKSQQMDALYQQYLKDPSQSRTFIDQGIITLYSKINDPTSVVRESEYARTPEGVSAINHIQGYFDKLQHGGSGITGNDLKDAVTAAKSLVEGSQAKYDEELKKAKSKARAAGVPEDFLMNSLGIETSNTSNPGITPALGNFWGKFINSSDQSSPDPLEMGVGGDPLGFF